MSAHVIEFPRQPLYDKLHTVIGAQQTYLPVPYRLSDAFPEKVRTLEKVDPLALKAIEEYMDELIAEAVGGSR